MGVEDATPKGHMANVRVGYNEDTGAVYYERRRVVDTTPADCQPELFPAAEVAALGLTTTPPPAREVTTPPLATPGESSHSAPPTPASHYMDAMNAAEARADEKYLLDLG